MECKESAQNRYKWEISRQVMPGQELQAWLARTQGLEPPEDLQGTPEGEGDWTNAPTGCLWGNLDTPPPHSRGCCGHIRSHVHVCIQFLCPLKEKEHKTTNIKLGMSEHIYFTCRGYASSRGDKAKASRSDM